jgi:hypothetical protein
MADILLLFGSGGAGGDEDEEGLGLGLGLGQGHGEEAVESSSDPAGAHPNSNATPSSPLYSPPPQAGGRTFQFQLQPVPPITLSLAPALAPSQVGVWGAGRVRELCVHREYGCVGI